MHANQPNQSNSLLQSDMLPYMSDVKQFAVEDTNRAFVGHCVSTRSTTSNVFVVLGMQLIVNTREINETSSVSVN